MASVWSDAHKSESHCRRKSQQTNYHYPNSSQSFTPVTRKDTQVFVVFLSVVPERQYRLTRDRIRL